MRMNIQNHIKIKCLTRSQLTSSVKLMNVLTKSNDCWMLKLVRLLEEKKRSLLRDEGRVSKTNQDKKNNVYI